MNVRDWLHVEDHVRALKSYNIGARAERCNAAVVERICDLLDGRRPRELGRSYSHLIAFVPDRETDAPAPLNVYGASKLAGEIAVAAASPRHLILRTSWVYSSFGTNFVKTMLRLASARKEIAVVADQRGNPSSALDIAAAVLRAAVAMGEGGAYGTYHLAGSGITSWADFARHVFSSSRARGGPWAEVRDITAAEFPVQAPRPLNTQLSTTKFAAAFGWTMPHWPRSLDEVVGRIF